MRGKKRKKKTGKTNETEQMFSDHCGLEDTEIVFQRSLKEPHDSYYPPPPPSIMLLCHCH